MRSLDWLGMTVYLLLEGNMKKNKKQPLVSIIMPVYNPGDYLVDAIESLRNQTYTNWELIAINDYSPDDSLRVLRSYQKKDKRVKIINLKKHAGIVKALNAGVQKAKGHFIARMDADDISLPERLETQVRFLTHNKDITLVGTQVEMVNEHRESLGLKPFPLEHDRIHEMLFYLCPLQHATMMTYSRILKQYSYEDHFATEDLALFFHLIRRGKFANVPEVLYQYRLLRYSFSFKKTRKTFFAALMVRLKAFLLWEYRPTIKGIILLSGQIIILSLLPDRLLLFIFNRLRFQKTPTEPLSSFKKQISFSLD